MRRAEFTRVPAKEAELLELLADGLTRTEMAERLGRSPRTIGNQMATLFLRLGVHNRSQAVRWWCEHRGELESVA